MRISTNGFRRRATAIALIAVLFTTTFTNKAAANWFTTTDLSGQNGKAIEDKQFGKLPLLFEKNMGQFDEDVRFASRLGGYALFLTGKTALFSLKVADDDASADIDASQRGHVTKTRSENVMMTFAGANNDPVIEGVDEAVTKTNFYTGRERIENISNYNKAVYRGLYDGIDAVFYGNTSNQLEYDFTVAPDADASQIKIEIDGAKSTEVNEKGDLVVSTENTTLVQQRPSAFQMIGGERQDVDVKYVVNGGSVTFELGEYDRSQTLTIDPALSYLTYVGGTGFDSIFEIAADGQNRAYISGTTDSLNFHGRTRSNNDADGAFVARLNAAGTAFEYVTILEGNGDDDGRGIAVDANGNAYVTGIGSHFFPTTSGAYDTVHGVLNNNDVFVAKLNSSGALVYSTFLGGDDEDEGFDVAIDASGKAYVVGSTFSNIAFPSKNKYQGCGFVFPTSLDSEDAFLTVINSSGSDITYSTCIGGSVTEDRAFSVALDSSNNAYVTGLAKGGNFPTKNAFQPDSGGGIDAWVAKFNPASSGEASLVYSTYLGGVGTDQGNAVAVNSSGQAHVVGLTGSTNYPLLNAFRSTNQINEAFVTVLNSSGTALVNSSFLGGADQDTANNVALDTTGSIYVTGSTLSNNFPLALPFQSVRAGVRDSYVTKLKFGRGVISSSYIGGSGNDIGNGVAVRGNQIFVAGSTVSGNLATTSGVVSQAFAGGANDGFVAKMLDTRLDSIGIFRPNVTFQVSQSTTNITSQTLTLTTPLSGANGVSGDFDGDGIDTTGTFTNGTWKVRNVNFPFLNIPATTFNFGVAGDRPVVGDWNGDGIDTAGDFRPGTGEFFLTNEVNASAINLQIRFGIAEDLPVAGDWNGDGIDTIGVFRPSTGQFFLTNSNDANPPIDLVTFFGTTGDLPLSGDFNGDGTDTIGVRRASTGEFFLSNDNVTIARQFVFGAVNTDQPIVGDWDGIPAP